jgi:hypothetical protein
MIDIVLSLAMLVLNQEKEVVDQLRLVAKRVNARLVASKIKDGMTQNDILRTTPWRPSLAAGSGTRFLEYDTQLGVRCLYFFDWEIKKPVLREIQFDPIMSPVEIETLLSRYRK